MRRLRTAIQALCLALLAATPALAQSQDLSALARLDPAASQVADTATGIDVTLAISQPVPWRIRLLDAPPRLLLDMREVDWTGLDRLPESSAHVVALRAGVLRPGWSRLVMELDGPYAVATSVMDTSGPTTVRLSLIPTTAQDFAARAALPEPDDWALPKPADLPPPVVGGSGPVLVMLDPGHGGLDPGAEAGDQKEADIVLTFARELKEVLVRDGGFRVALTRDEDVFVPLETRLTLARQAGAQLFLSLHADALAEGEAVGATVYTLAEDASDAAAAALAERHDRDDLLAGVDLSDQDDTVALVLMDMARTETAPRTERLAQDLVTAIKAAQIKMHRHPHQEAGFSVLKSPDMPSVLIEIGFLSSESDRKRLNDPAWRARMAAAIRDGLKTWAAQDAALSAARAP
ncbi:N-acetylmuramoyl-L-alanine amidase [Neotabrizicola shimadae]|uniref:N-acetylmuramoyl-L-alanine amidase n=1 Tax=Neotabrizicola shimadae TaxID=2807096 RepID=A0A8G0ZXQ9_9RHOB|nr:N-acetylmuramoyl-L-alanine amidase [Neotabrizicola shimadae]QYZ71405.1 N-acetylmuramoyl-L-alanine amidase [Neotabrizicola shimadae]